MAVHLDHLLVPARDRVAAARLLAQLLGVAWAAQGAAGPFSPVYVNDGLTLDFDEWPEPIPKQHYCFRVEDVEFDAILERIRAAGIAYRSLPHGADDGRVLSAFGGRIVYWGEPDGHVWELLTVSYAREAIAPAPGASARGDRDGSK
jgi:catechol 2,3-dioxygenase-like lactoylglutathione lyase family enzyme